MRAEIATALIGSMVLAGVHTITPLMTRLPEQYRVLLNSFSAGVGLAYIFLYLLFELAKYGATEIHALLPLGPEPLETLFIVLLSAFSAVYLLQVRLEQNPDPRDDYLGFAILFLVYNFLAGAGVVEEAYGGVLNLGLYVTALSLHLLFNDLFLSHLCPGRYYWRWRIALAAMPVIGCAFAVGFALSKGMLYGILAVVAGGTIINIVRHELPSPPRFRPTAFVVGVAIYAALIIATWRF